MITEKQILHRQYLQSPLWKKVREKAIKHYGQICARCGEFGNDVHHLTYERSGGNELLEDLQVVCRSCHDAIHRVERSEARNTKKQKSKQKRRGVTIQALFSFLTEDQKKIIEKEFGCPCFSILCSPTMEGFMARTMAKKMLDVHYILGITERNYCGFSQKLLTKISSIC